MGREHIEFIEAGDVPASDATSGMLAGTRRRLLSEDDENGALTAIHNFPAGWSGDLAEEASRPIELFVLTGAINVAGNAVGEGCYAFLPAAGDQRSLSAESEAQVLVMLDPERANASGGPAKIVDPSGERWISADLDGADIRPGSASSSCTRTQRRRTGPGLPRRCLPGRRTAPRSTTRSRSA